MAEQVYVTHCIQSDSVKNQGGFSIRAASTQDPEFLRFAVDYPAYELPLDMWSLEPAPANAPVRLAYLPGPHGTTALVHSAYAGKDTLGRPGNFFTHVVFFPSLTTTQALESWGAAQWCTAYRNGEPKELPKLGDNPLKGSLLSQKALTLFLAGRLSDEGKLAVQILPPRMRGDAASARTLLARMMHALLLAWNDGQSTRQRVYVLGEPGLIALLLYGAAQLFPEVGAAGLTFSTFESMHRSLRQHKLTLACATYTGNSEKSLEPDYLRRRGFGFDTFDSTRCSPELAGAAPEVIEELIELAAQGKWDDLRLIRQCHGKGKPSEDSLKAARQMCKTLERVQEKKLTVEELLNLTKSNAGLDLIERNEESFWPIVYEYSFKSEAVRQNFSGLIKEHFPELLARSGDLLAEQNPNWKSPWSLVKAVEKTHERLPDYWRHVLKRAGKAAPERAFIEPLRIALLQEWNQVCPGGDVDDSIQELLSITSARQFENLRKASLPERWLGVALRQALTGNTHPGWVAQTLEDLPEGVLQHVASALNEKKPTDLLSCLKLLFPQDGRLALFFRLLKHGLRIAPEVAINLLEGRTEELLQGENLRFLLAGLIPEKARAARFTHYAKSLSTRLLLEESDHWNVYTNLVAAGGDGYPRPAEAMQILDDWGCLQNALSDPNDKTGAEALQNVCRRCQADLAFFQEFFQSRVREEPPDSPRLAAFARTFAHAFPAGNSFHPQLNRFDKWLQVILAADPKKASSLKCFFLQRHVVAEQQLPVARERKMEIGESLYQTMKKQPAVKKAEPVRMSTPVRSSAGAAMAGFPTRKRAAVLTGLLLSHLVVGAAGCWMSKAPTTASSSKLTEKTIGELKGFRATFDAKTSSLKSNASFADSLQKFKSAIDENEHADLVVDNLSDLARATGDLAVELAGKRDTLTNELKNLDNTLLEGAKKAAQHAGVSEKLLAKFNPITYRTRLPFSASARTTVIEYLLAPKEVLFVPLPAWPIYPDIIPISNQDSKFSELVKSLDK